MCVPWRVRRLTEWRGRATLRGSVTDAPAVGIRDLKHRASMCRCCEVEKHGGGAVDAFAQGGRRKRPRRTDWSSAVSLTLTPPAERLTKTQLVEAILELNATASREWLMSFEFTDLRGYWLRLQHAMSPRGNGWDGSRAA